MKTTSLAYTRYWQNSLADAVFNHGGLQANETASFYELSSQTIQTGRLAPDLLHHYFAKHSPEQDIVEVVIRPFVYRLLKQTDTKSCQKLPTFLTPIIATAFLTRSGKLYPAKTSFARDLLEPTKQYGYTITSAQEAYNFLNRHPIPTIPVPASTRTERLDDAHFSTAWCDYIQSCCAFFQSVCAPWLKELDEYKASSYGYISKNTCLRPYRYVHMLYEHLCKTHISVPLYDIYANGYIGALKEPADPQKTLTQRLAHTNRKQPLTTEQRNILSHATQYVGPEILAVNTVPGSEKIELLHATITTLWVQAILEKTPPPVIWVTSTHTPSLCNIIESFNKKYLPSKGPFGGRWLPHLYSLSTYFPSNNSTQTLSSHHHTPTFFEKIETSKYIERAQEQFLTLAKVALPEVEKITVASAVKALSQRIRSEAQKLETLEHAWHELNKINRHITDKLGDNPIQAIETCQKSIEKAIAEKELCHTLSNQWEDFKKHNLDTFSNLFCWLPSVSQKRLNDACDFLTPLLPDEIASQQWQSIEQIDTEVQSLIDQKNQNIQHHEKELEQLNQLLQQQKICVINWTEAISVFKKAQLSPQATLADADKLADTTIRFNLFLLAIHYWEGRWLLEMLETLASTTTKNKYSLSAHQKRWQRYAMLTPCLATHIQNVPKHFKVQCYRNNTFINHYLYNFADLLIIDDAQQISPEIAGAVFALTQKALIFGDTQQHQPLTPIAKHLDMGNLLKYGLISEQNAEIDFIHQSKQGKTASAGNVMLIAQHSTPYRSSSELSPGLHMLNHRYCFDDIISYSNNLCYQGQLEAQRGMKFHAATLANGSQDDLPALGYLHINGVCAKTATNSYYNALEAQIIASWLKHNQDRLECLYKKPLSQIVTIITPFNAQIKAIELACQKEGINLCSKANPFTITTVYTLQGIHSPIIIFSAVGSKHMDSPILDQSPYLLNTAVSCAENTFLIFGDMDIYEQAHPLSPRGQLISLLIQNKDYALSFDPLPPRQDLIKEHNTLISLQNQHEHEAFFYKILGGNATEIYLASAGLSIQHLHNKAIFHLLAAAAKRGAYVCVYTDLDLDVLSDNPFANTQTLKNNLNEAIKLLQAHDINVHVVKKIHQSLLIRDDNIYCVGTYNWFKIDGWSIAQRNAVSHAYFGPELAQEIELHNACLQRQTIKQGYPSPN